MSNNSSRWLDEFVDDGFNCDRLQEYITEKGIDVNAQFKLNGKTALHYVIQSEKIKCVEILVNAGADVNIQDEDGNTPVHLAAMAENAHENNIWEPIEILGLLLNTGKVDFTIENNEGQTPLDVAIEYKKIKGRLFTIMYESMINSIMIVSSRTGNNEDNQEGGKRSGATAKRSGATAKRKSKKTRKSKKSKKSKKTRKH